MTALADALHRPDYVSPNPDSSYMYGSQVGTPIGDDRWWDLGVVGPDGQAALGAVKYDAGATDHTAPDGATINVDGRPRPALSRLWTGYPYSPGAQPVYSEETFRVGTTSNSGGSASAWYQAASVDLGRSGMTIDVHGGRYGNGNGAATVVWAVGAASGPVHAGEPAPGFYVRWKMYDRSDNLDNGFDVKIIGDDGAVIMPWTTVTKWTDERLSLGSFWYLRIGITSSQVSLDVAQRFTLGRDSTGANVDYIRSISATPWTWSPPAGTRLPTGTRASVWYGAAGSSLWSFTGPTFRGLRTFSIAAGGRPPRWQTNRGDGLAGGARWAMAGLRTRQGGLWQNGRL